MSRKPPIRETAKGKGWEWLGLHGAEGMVIAGSEKIARKVTFQEKSSEFKKNKHQTKNLKPFNPERNTSMHVFVIAEESEIQRTVENVVVKSPNLSFPVVLHWEM